MNDRPRTRQDLYDRIRATSKEEVILEDMLRLGFWPAEGVLPQDPAEEIRRRGEIQRDLTKLHEENRQLYNEQALLKELRKRRLQESRRKKQETKERHERERLERAAAWKARQQEDIVYLGERVSGGLSERQGDDERLRAAGLPIYKTASDVAAALGIGVGALRFLCFDRRTATVSHYVRFKLPKKTGGERQISAPLPRLKAAQSLVLKNVLEKLPLHDAAHGFRAGRSIVTNARPHLGRAVVVNLDLKDFFPGISYRRVKGLFRALGYAEAVATILALLCTEPAVEEVELDGKRYFVATSDRHLPQGAPTSPAITNLLCRRLDRRLEQMAAELGFGYTRYADDLSFSGADAARAGKLLRRVHSIVAHEGFCVHDRKTRVQRSASRQEVTGVVVNQKPGVPREVLRRFRATLFQIDKDGPAGKRWGPSRDLFASILGFANYVRMVDPEKGAELLVRVKALLVKHGWRPPPRSKPQAQVKPPAPAAPPKAPEPEKSAPKKKWWKLF